MEPSPIGVSVADPRQEITKYDLDFKCLHAFIDVVYGAVLSYGVYAVAQSLDPLLAAPPRQPAWTTLTLLGFVTYYLVADVVEARIYTARFPYDGRDRFIVDLGIAGCFLLAYMAAAKESIAVLLAMSGIMFGGGIWSAFLEVSTKRQYHWRWPRMLTASHLAAGALLLFAYGRLWWHADYVLGFPGAAAIWAFYLIWDLVLIVIARVWNIPAAEADLMPVGLIESFVRRCVAAWGPIHGFWRGDTE